MSTPILSGDETSPSPVSVTTSAGSTTNPYTQPAILTVSNDGAASVRIGTTTSTQGGKVIQAGTQGVEVATYQGGAVVNMRADAGTCSVEVCWSQVGEDA